MTANENQIVVYRPNVMSADLKAAFPDMKGWSRSNLMYMRQFADAWMRKEIVQEPLGQLPWYHHLALLECVKSRGDRIAYAALAIENGWSRNVMVHQIELGAADRHGTAITNFKKLMPPADSDMAEQTLKGEYDLGFLPATAMTKENKLRAMLVDKVAKFMVELGAGFSYVGKGLIIDVGGDEFEIDLLFYHLVLHRYRYIVTDRSAYPHIASVCRRWSNFRRSCGCFSQKGRKAA